MFSCTSSTKIPVSLLTSSTFCCTPLLTQGPNPVTFSVTESATLPGTALAAFTCPSIASPAAFAVLLKPAPNALPTSLPTLPGASTVARTASSMRPFTADPTALAASPGTAATLARTGLGPLCLAGSFGASKGFVKDSFADCCKELKLSSADCCSVCASLPGAALMPSLASSAFALSPCLAPSTVAVTELLTESAMRLGAALTFATAMSA
mmetsp:Transcript_39587/g.93267  ORF Transcript_39587/g.93267 Transcript_39587/m.93267 type:complete len:210 (-) Transcript_39587:685-1314(-)